MPVPESACILAGFVMAHAVWSQSDLPPGEAFVPLAIVEQSGERKLARFSAESAQSAVENGRTELRQASGSIWALAYAIERSVAFRYDELL